MRWDRLLCTLLQFYTTIALCYDVAPVQYGYINTFAYTHCYSAHSYTARYALIHISLAALRFPSLGFSYVNPDTTVHLHWSVYALLTTIPPPWHHSTESSQSIDYTTTTQYTPHTG